MYGLAHLMELLEEAGTAIPKAYDASEIEDDHPMMGLLDELLKLFHMMEIMCSICSRPEVEKLSFSRSGMAW